MSDKANERNFHVQSHTAKKQSHRTTDKSANNKLCFYFLFSDRRSLKIENENYITSSASYRN